MSSRATRRPRCTSPAAARRLPELVPGGAQKQQEEERKQHCVPQGTATHTPQRRGQGGLPPPAPREFRKQVDSFLCDDERSPKEQTPFTILVSLPGL